MASPVVSAAVSHRLPGLDGLRGLAILMVLFHHLFVFAPAGFLGRHLAVVVEFASHGVDLFFALSGFLIARQLAGGRSDPDFSRRFWLHRCAKIIPLYLVITFGVFVLLKPALVFTGHDEKLRWLVAGREQWPWYLFFISNIRNAIDAAFTNPALDVSWSLAVEVQFYLLAFITARVVAPAHWARVAWVAIGAALLFRLAAVSAGAGWVTILVLTPGRLDAFGFGCLAAMAPAFLARCPNAIFFGLGALPFLTPWSRENPAVEVLGYSLVALAAGMAIERISRRRPPATGARLLEHPFLTMFGRISYSVYLTHVPLRAVLRDTLLSPVRTLDSPAAWLAQMAFWLGAGAACTLVGWLTWRFLEEPARRALVGLRRSAVAVPTCPVP